MRENLLNEVGKHCDMYSKIVQYKAQLREQEKVIDRILNKLAEFED